MAKHLIVRSHFGGREPGDRITDPDEVAAVLAGETAGHVVAIEAPDPVPEPVPEPEHVPESVPVPAPASLPPAKA